MLVSRTVIASLPPARGRRRPWAAITSALASTYLVLVALVALLAMAPAAAGAQALPSGFDFDHFRQLEEILPTPNAYRTASGAPGHGYWQQRADYLIDVTINDDEQSLSGSETITYTNNSPDTLSYLWLQLDNNIFSAQSAASLTETAPDFEELPFSDLHRLLTLETFDGRVTLHSVTETDGTPLPFTVVGTMVRIDLPEPLTPAGTFGLSVEWSYRINDHKALSGRTGYEYFPDDGNYIYEIAHWYPRLVSYTDVNGWQHKQFIGRGEFTLELGDYLMRITVPDDHIVAATGVLQNPEEVLTNAQVGRLSEATSAEKPVFIVTEEEAEANEGSAPTGTKTWVYAAENVRDVAFATSRKFIWDAILHTLPTEDGGEHPVWAMSYYPKEAEPLWSRYSTRSVTHTLDVYSRFTFTYPYPVAISVNGPVGGMEYPMICFNGPRPEEDGTYWDESVEGLNNWRHTKYGLISVIIHEVGHNYFPMIVNSDERQWTWMDEGLNTFLQFIAEREWEDDYPARRGEPRDIVEFMASEDQVPIMTNSESLLQFGNNAYAKPATALVILRETILGREVFDFAFQEYSRRWKFKRPMPADFFRTMEDASGIDLDWFWRGWFYSTNPVDIAIADVNLYRLDSLNPDVEKPRQKAERDAEPRSLTEERNQDLPKLANALPELKDFYNSYDPLDVTPGDRRDYQDALADLDENERKLLETQRYFYVVGLENLGGLVMPVLLEITYEDGTVEQQRIPAEIWRHNPERAEKLLMTQQPITSITLDPRWETADIDRSNNHFPAKPIETRFQIFQNEKIDNPMRKAQEEAGGGS